jgi:cholesterol oxidase
MSEPLSRPLKDAKARYDAIVVGSGYGGGVAAARLARMGRRVAVLERGREIPLGRFPSRLSEANREMQVTGPNVKLGSATALFDVRLNPDVCVLMGCGLGGTSLINANVCLEPDPRALEHEAWPVEVRSDGLLRQGMGRARAMLRPSTYPGPDLVKLKHLARTAQAFGSAVERVPLHIAFDNGVNAAGVRQSACTLCGDCCGGCNVGAKTTTALTYLPDATGFGAEIFTEALVRTVLRAADGSWQLTVRDIGEKGLGEERAIHAGVVVLAAGTLGSSEILLRSREQGLALSERLGERFTTNGDALAMAYNCKEPVNSVGVGHPPRVKTEPVGPAVSGFIDLRRRHRLEDGIVICEASIPSSMAAALPALLVPGAPAIGTPSSLALGDQIDEAGRALKSLVAGAYKGAVRNTETFLAVGHDAGTGRLKLQGDRVAVDWPKAQADPVFAEIETAFKRAAGATGGTYVKNPMSLAWLGGNLLTVHPLGGCVMGADRTQGVVNHKGQVFDGAAGAAASAVHAGLYVADGAVIPRPLGVHPLFTITALAERSMIHLARDYGWAMTDRPARPAPWDPPRAAAPVVQSAGLGARLRRWLGA